jgi:hypothetical protein
MKTKTGNGTVATTDKSSLDSEALNKLLGQMVNDLGAAVNGALIVLGDRLGIYAALADSGPATRKNLPKRRSFTNANSGSGLALRRLPAMSAMTEQKKHFILRLNRLRCLPIRPVRRP